MTVGGPEGENLKLRTRILLRRGKIADTDMANFEIADEDTDMKVFEATDTDMNFRKIVDTDTGRTSGGHACPPISGFNIETFLYWIINELFDFEAYSVQFSGNAI